MKLMHKILLFSAALLYAPVVHAEDHDSLQIEDIKTIMKDILGQHLTERTITPNIIRQSFIVYINQFDPDRIYLLQNEVQSFLNPSDQDLVEYMQQYQRGDFSSYRRLNETIDNAIVRARELRQQVERDKSHLFSEASRHRPSRERGEHQDREFAANVKELESRIQNDLIEFIEEQKVKFGGGKVNKSKARILALYNNEMVSHEDSYLPNDSDGRPLTEKEAEHRFTLHVLKALAKSLDAHTKFFDSSEAYDVRVRLEKGYEGTGLVFEESLDGPIVMEVTPNSPAARNGRVEKGDVLITVDGQSVTDLSFPQAMNLLRGDVGTFVRLNFKRDVETPQERSYDIELRREEITVLDDRVETSYEKFGDGIIGTIRLESFYQSPNGISSEDDVKNAIQHLKTHGTLRGLILDLRDNSGGYLSQAVKVAGLFITNGVVVISKYNDGEVKVYRDLDGRTFYNGPLVVLVSKGTASAAEIVAQALQDYGVGLVVGDAQTYGKGSIQSQTVTDSATTSYFKVTVGKYYTVSGRTPQIRGVEADIVVPTHGNYGQIGEEFLDFPLTQDSIQPAYEDSLADIHPDIRGWFLKYYLPTVQKRKANWVGMVDKLRENSSYRIAHNRDYQLFFENPKAGSASYILTPQKPPPTDIQQQEAINILKDMFLLQSDMSDDYPGVPKIR